MQRRGARDWGEREIWRTRPRAIVRAPLTAQRTRRPMLAEAWLALDARDWRRAGKSVLFPAALLSPRREPPRCGAASGIGCERQLDQERRNGDRAAAIGKLSACRDGPSATEVATVWGAISTRPFDPPASTRSSRLRRRFDGWRGRPSLGAGGSMRVRTGIVGGSLTADHVPGDRRDELVVDRLA
jgi:hypothetical protein